MKDKTYLKFAVVLVLTGLAIISVPAIASTTNGPRADGANLFVSVYNDQQHFTYSDHGGNLQDAWYGTHGWHLQQLTGRSPAVSGEYLVPLSAPTATAGSLNVSVHNDQQHFAYIDVNGRVARPRAKACSFASAVAS